MSGAQITQAVGLILDREPDERGNLLAAALMSGGRRIALTVNAN